MIHTESPPRLPGVMEENREKSQIEVSGCFILNLYFNSVINDNMCLKFKTLTAEYVNCLSVSDILVCLIRTRKSRVKMTQKSSDL